MDQTEIDVINAYIKNLAERVQSLTVEILYQKSKMQCLERDLVIKNEAIDEMQRLLGGEAHIVKPAETEEEYAGGVIKEESESEYSLVAEESEESVSEYSSAPVRTPSIPNTRRQRQQVPPQPTPAPVKRQVTAPPPVEQPSSQEVKTGQTLGSETVVISDGGEYAPAPQPEKSVVVEAPKVEEMRVVKQLSTRGKGDRSQRRRRRNPIEED